MNIFYLHLRKYLAAVSWGIALCSPLLSHAADSLQDIISDSPPAPEITIFTAKQFITMAKPERNVNAVAVQEGKIIDLGSLSSLQARLKGNTNITIDEQFSDKVITPGLIEPHMHLWLFALVSNAKFITPADWNLPWDNVKGVVGHEPYLQRLKEYEASLIDPNELLFTWGYHQYFHGKLDRQTLDDISSTRPIIIWQRSVHEMYFNTKALEMLGIEESDWQNKGEASTMANWAEGHVWEKGLYLAVEKVFPIIASPEKFKRGLERGRQYVHAGGITSSADPGVQLPESLIRSMIDILESDTMPFDYDLIPAGNSIYDSLDKDLVKTLAAVRNMSKLSGEHIQWLPNRVKLFTDGAVYSQLMQMKDGYLDGHHGEWIQTPEDFAATARAFWLEDYQIMVHANGDKGVEVAVDTLEKLQHEYPRYDHRFGLHHVAYSSKDDIQRLGRLGGTISTNPFYLHVLGEQYGKQGVGKERSDMMSRGRTVLDNGINLSLHSDAPMAPARPMQLVWAAVNRTGLSGKTLGPEEKITIEEAFRAITIDAAFEIGKEKEVGSIEIGKRANFAVFDNNPLLIKPQALKETVIRATVFNGEVFPITAAASTLAMSPENQKVHELLQDESIAHGDVCTTNQLFQFAARQSEEKQQAL